jgi:hypothetical protein
MPQQYCRPIAQTGTSNHSGKTKLPIESFSYLKVSAESVPNHLPIGIYYFHSLVSRFI